MVSVLSQTPQATSEASYQYAYDGKRNSKYIDGTLYDYTYTGSNLLETYADTAGRIAKYTYGNALISQTNASGDSYSILTDYQNSVIALLNPSTIHGPLSTAFAYDPFGKLRYTNNPDSPQTLGWLSRQFDSETGNNYLINRYYSSDRGSFLSPDQYQYVNNATPFTFNLYQYAYANPVLNVDPEGLESKKINGQKYQLVPISGSDEMFPIHQGYYDILNKLIGTNGGTITIFDNDGKVHNIRFTKKEVQNQQGTIRLFESRFLALYGEKRGLDHVQITTAAAEFSSKFVAAAVSVPGMGALMRMKWLAGAFGAYTAGTMSHHFGERLAERQEEGSNVFSSTLGATSDALMLSELYGAVTNRDIITGENAGYSIERRSGILGGFVGGLFGGWQLATESSFTRIEGEISPKRIVIGENMERVAPYAKKIGAEIYEGMPGFKPGMEAEGLLHNQQVIQQKMAEGYQIIDIGPDFARRSVRGGPQPAYQMERTITKGYEGYQKAFIRIGKDSLILPEP